MPSIAKATRRAHRCLKGRRAGLDLNVLDVAFGVTIPHLLVCCVGRGNEMQGEPDFPYAERARRRKINKRQRAARRAGR